MRGLERGFKALHKRYNENKRKMSNIKDCQSCQSYFADNEEDKEYCHNNSVTEFDIIIDNNRTYCVYWSPIWAKPRGDFE